MDLGFLDKSSNVTPLLVRLYDSERVYSLAKDNKPGARGELVSAVSELLEHTLSPRESELIADVLIGLMRQAEVDLRRALAERLAAMDNVPFRLVLQLANDDIEVSGAVLRKSPVLGDLDLIYIIKSKGPEYWRAIAAREKMSHQIMNLLADTRDFETALTLAQNEGIRLSEHVLTVLSDMSQKSDALALPLLRREEVPGALAKRLYQYVGAEVKALIEERYHITGTPIADAVDDVVSEMVDSAELSGTFSPAPSMMKAAERYKDKGLLTIKLMMGALRRGQISSFIAQFSFFTGLRPETVLEILSQPGGQGLAVACKAFEVPKEDFISIFLLTNRVRNAGRMVDLNDMTKAISYYDRVKADVARDIIQNSMERLGEI